MLPSPFTILAGVVVAFFVVLVVVRGPIDADYWWHLTTGQLILDQRAVPTVDPFSFAYDGPWVAHEWLGEVIIAGLIEAVGWSATAALFGLAAAAAILVPAYAVHRQGVGASAIVPLLGIGVYGLAAYATVRPQVLSWLLLGVLMAGLLRLRPNGRYGAWLFVPMMGIWANLHGLYVVGIGVLALYAAFTMIGRTPMASHRFMTVGIFLAASIAVVITPAGPAGLVYPLRYLRQDDWGTAFIAEWQAVDVTDPRQWAVIALIVCAVLLVKKARFDWVTTAGVSAMAGALIAVRNGPIAIVTSIPMLALTLDRWLAERRLLVPTEQRRQRQRRVAELIAGAVVVVAILLILPGTTARSERETFPVDAFDRLEDEQADARLLVDYDWAGYAIHRVHDDEGQVFIDGRSDMYPREIFENYLSLRDAEEEWPALIETYDVEAILLRPSAPLVTAAERADWCRVYADADSVLLLPCESR